MTAMDYASAAKELSGKGRNGDSMLVHMTPEEVGGLQNLAMAAGGSLSINPDTGLVEASFLKKLLPTLLGVGLAATGIGAPLAGLIVGGGQTLLTGDINKGLMAGLGAFGGGALAGAAGLGAAGGAAAKIGAASALPGGAAGAAPSALTPGISGAAAKLASTGAPALQTGLGSFGTSMAPMGGLGLSGFGSAAGMGATAAKTGLAGFAQKFGAEAAGGLGGMAAKAAPYAAGAGLLDAANQASMPTMQMPGEEDKWNYEGPYLPQDRVFNPRATGPDGRGETLFFENANPIPGYMPMRGMAEGGLAALPAAGDLQATMDFFRSNSPGPITASMRPVERPAPQAPAGAPASPAPGQGEQRFTFAGPTQPVPQFGRGMQSFGGGAGEGTHNFDGGESLRGILRRINEDSYTSPFAKGGEVDMKDGSFVIDARTVSELGNGSSNAGIERLAGMGGRPVRGDGDGVSDSVPARIGGRQEARVARDEVIFSPEAVTRLGGGNHSKGTKKLYAMMDKAHAARKRAKRGQDTKVAKGLGALA